MASAALAVATIRMSDYNVRGNLPHLTDSTAAGEVRQSSAGDLKKAIHLLGEIEQAASEYLPL